MRAAVVLIALILAPAASASAEDHRVPQNALSQLGLGAMQNVSHERAMEVRGRGRLSLASGLSFVSGIVLDPHSTTFLGGTDTNTATAFSEIVGRNVAAESLTTQTSSLGIELNVDSGGIIFQGLIIGQAGGAAFSRGR